MDVALSAFKDFEIRSLALPHLDAWLEAMLNRESYQKTCLEPERIKELYSHFLNLDYFNRMGVAD
jgi:glutathione S-transferase